MKNFKNYVTLNFLSILGLIFFVLSLIAVFYFYPNAITYDKTSGEDAPYGMFSFLYICGFFLFFNTLLELVVLSCVLIEFAIYKYKKIVPKFFKFSEKLEKFHTIFFTSGLVFSIFSLILGLTFIFLPV